MSEYFGIGQVLNGLLGLAGLLFYLGMLYFGFILMRVHPGRWERVFFWAALGQLAGLILVAVMGVVVMILMTRLSGPGFMDGDGVNWLWVIMSMLKGLVLLCALVGAVALVAATARGGEATKAG